MSVAKLECIPQFSSLEIKTAGPEETFRGTDDVSAADMPRCLVAVLADRTLVEAKKLIRQY